MNIFTAAQEGMANAAKTVAREQGLKYNGAYQCVACKDDNKNCNSCARMDNDNKNLNAMTLLEDL